MNIKVQANDALAAKLEQMRTFEIYPDAKGDATLLIDVDDASRLVVRPTDMAEKSLWICMELTQLILMMENYQMSGGSLDAML